MDAEIGLFSYNCALVKHDDDIKAIDVTLIYQIGGKASHPYEWNPLLTVMKSFVINYICVSVLQ